MQNGSIFFDVGNSCLKICLLRADSQKVICRFPIEPYETADNLGLKLFSFCQYYAVEPDEINKIAACSVVPWYNDILKNAVCRFFNARILFAGEDFCIPLKNQYGQPDELGTDRLLAAYAARVLFEDSPSLIIADYGTAITFDCVENDNFIGGMIFPGMKAALFGLEKLTAKLPFVSIPSEVPESIPCKNTKNCMIAGLLCGYEELSKGICKKLEKRLGPHCKKIATGGAELSFLHTTDIFDAFVDNLVLKGLELIGRHL